ncbi:oligopeptide transport system substrate-binding protein [Pilibacter termitis]|uniref:Oligopeptide transport system substrate-binding protein n=1 Tax=Pilibacter termitis TaxID=263852 RepID=A0A1T4N4H4_9ENTE|nr:peptide ABC transporter substrate-binding protein [Pilibacter termitis]SJZ74064.1 oligopeptide transport system substrate-binding protein [Pilibacter termitis]
MKKRKTLITLSLLAPILLSACSNGNESKKEETQEKTVHLMSQSELTTLDSAALLDFPDAITHTAAFEGLYTLDDKDNVIPAAAKELPEISTDGLTYTITLREGMKWSDEKAVTAHDFEYAWKRVADPKNSYIYSFLIQETIQNGVEVANGEKEVDSLGVKSLDDLTLQVTLKEPKPFFTSLLTFSTFFPQNEDAVKKYGKKYGTTADSVAYNGPFIVENWEHSATSWDLKKNKQYWDKDNVNVENIHYETVKEGNTALNLFDNKKLDLAYLSGSTAQMNLKHENFKSYPTATMNYIRFNQKRNGKPTPLANENLRKALALGIDKDNLVKNVIADGSQALNGMVTSEFFSNEKTGVDFRKDAGDVMAYNKEEAQKYWKLAQKELGEKVTIELMSTDAEVYKKFGESIQNQWQENFSGLTVDVRALPTETALNLSRESNYDAFLIYWTPDYKDPISTLKMLYSGNDRNYSNKKFDELIDKASKDYALDPEKRWEVLKEAEKVALEETAGMAVLSQNQQTVLQNPDLEGVNFHTFASPLTLKDLKWKN